MKSFSRIPVFFLLLSINLIYSQNHNTLPWHGISVSLSDNTDALDLNPAGLGIYRGEQFAFNIQQSENLNENNKNVFTTSFIQRFGSGFALQHQYDELNKYRWSIGYGLKVDKNIYVGFKYHKDKDYSLGVLYRPYNFISSGITFYTDQQDTYKDIRYGIAIKPFNFKKKTRIDADSFAGYSNLSLGFDRLVGYDDDWNSDNHENYFFVNFNIVPGFNMGINKYSNSYAINMSLNFGNDGVHYSTYGSDNFYSNSTTNGFGYFNYSQKQKSEIENIIQTKDNYVWLDLEGYIIEEKPTTSPFDFLEININPFGSGNNLEGVQLKSFIDQINDISNNKSIKGLVINLKNLQAGFGKRKEIHDALINFKEQGKKIIVYSEQDISNMNYYLVSMADEIYTSELSGIELSGINMEMIFLRGLLDTLYIVPEVIRVSPYKTAVDLLLNDKMSEEMKENYGQMVDDLYEIMVADISNARGWLESETLNKIDSGPYYNSFEAISEGMISGTMYPEEFKEYIENSKIDLINWGEFTPTEYYNYDWLPDDTPKIAVIYAVGGIVSGKSNPGPLGSSIMGDKTIKEAIIKAREDESIKAIILRIDSGGGSALASDMMWKEVRNTTDPKSDNKKPFIVSMSDVAASGGYYIACDADYIVADPTTITGSIGVIWARLNFTKLMNKIGITSDGIKRGDNADFGSSSHLMTNQEKERFLSEINRTYDIFKKRVIDGRDNLNDMNELDNLALGRVWSGKSAIENGLIDELGGLHKTIDIAKSKANIVSSADVQIVEYPEVKEFSFFDFFDNQEELKILELKDILPQDVAKELEILEIVPVLMNNEVLMMMPYQIEIN